jgi:hypothetical protein
MITGSQFFDSKNGCGGDMTQAARVSFWRICQNVCRDYKVTGDRVDMLTANQRCTYELHPAEADASRPTGPNRYVRGE